MSTYPIQREGARTSRETTVMDIIRVTRENELVVLVAVKPFREWRKDNQTAVCGGVTAI